MKRIALPLLLLLGIARAPVHAQLASDLGWTAVGAGAVLAGSALLDRPIREELFLESDHEAGGAARLTSALAEPIVLVPAFALVYGAGRALHDGPLQVGVERASTALAVSFAAGGVVKAVVGRARPYAGADPDAMYPFTLAGGRQSFPSGHTAAAFALAATLADAAPTPALKVLAFAPAVAVGWSRLYADVHWSSDVVAGALLGLASARLAKVLLPAAAPERVDLSVTPQGVAVRIPLP